MTFFAVFPGELNGNQSFGTWVIDGSPPTHFIIDGQTVSSSTLYHQGLFKTTPDVEHGPHNLTVVYMGTSNQAPLYLDTRLVTDAPLSASPTDTPTVISPSSNPTSPSITISPGPSSSSTDSPSPSVGNPSHDNGRSNTGAIAGGAVGGVALLICAVFLAYWLRRRSASLTVAHVAADPVDEIDDGPRPYMASSADFTPAGGTYTPPPRSKEQTTAGAGASSARAATSGYLPSELPTSSMSSSTAFESQMALVTASQTWLPLGASFQAANMEGVVQTTEPFAVVHADSGLRLQTPQRVDLPPTYTVN